MILVLNKYIVLDEETRMKRWGKDERVKGLGPLRSRELFFISRYYGFIK